MSHSLRLIALFVFAVILTGCTTMGRSPSSYKLVMPTTAKGMRCVQRCKTMKNTCYKMCHNVDPSCLDQEKNNAKQRFDNYRQKTVEKEENVEKSWQDFYNPNVCKDTVCGCHHDYRACVQLCGGQLVPNY